MTDGAPRCPHSTQRARFDSGETERITHRTEALQRLESGIRAWTGRLVEARRADGFVAAQTFMLREVLPVLHETRHTRDRLKAFARRRRVRSALAMFKARSYTRMVPLGCVAMVGHHVDPLRSLLVPLAGALGAGCTAVVQPSPLAPATAAVITRMLRQYFPPEDVLVLEGNETGEATLTACRYDMMWVDAGPDRTPAIVAAAAAAGSPVAWTAGGVCPAIVHADADLPMTARRLVWGRFAQAGRVRMAPGMLLVHEEVAEELLDRIRVEIQRAFSPQPRNSRDFGYAASGAGDFVRMGSLLAQGRILHGGEMDEGTGYVAPTLLADVPLESPLLQHESFAPILPVRTFRTLDEARDVARALPTPPACFVFTTNIFKGRALLTSIRSGGGVLNDAALHEANPRLPHGGIGAGGHGRTGGEAGLRLFSAEVGEAEGSNFVDLPLRFAPMSDFKMRILRALFRIHDE